jgi:hypothetical protein
VEARKQTTTLGDPSSKNRKFDRLILRNDDIQTQFEIENCVDLSEDSGRAHRQICYRASRYKKKMPGYVCFHGNRNATFGRLEYVVIA